jgi:hypothetical protein
MNKLFNIIREEVQLFLEGSFTGQGVADKFYQNHFHVSTNKPDLKAMAGMLGNPYGYVIIKNDRIPVFKNPKSLEYFGGNVRAISDYDGNIYVAQRDSDFNHGELGFGIKLHKNPQMIYTLPNEFLLLLRQGLTNSFVLSDVSENKLEDNPEIVLDMIDAVRHRNPQFRFIPERMSNDDIDESSYTGQGVGDTFLQKQFHVSTNKPNLKAMAGMQKELEKPFANIKGIIIYKNPRNLDNFDFNVRAIGDIDGNLYVAQTDGDFTHHEMGQEINLDVWQDENIVRLMRVNNTNVFGLTDYANNPKFLKEIFQKLSERNSMYQFVNMTDSDYRKRKGLQYVREGLYKYR